MIKENRSGSPLTALVHAIPLVVGVLAMALVMGGKVIAPSNIAWLQEGDSAQHYLGWVFYRASEWTLPLGLNPAFGMKLSSSIVFSDSIPLLAIPFKLFADYLPQDFQYFGLWIWLCFVLQAVFGFRLASVVTDDVAIRVMSCVFFAIAPPMLFRIGGHLALAGHFLILAAFYGVLRRDRHTGIDAWVVLVATASLVHAYLLVMVLAIWSAGLADRWLCRQIGIGRGLKEAAIVLGVLGLVAWQAGYFAVSDGPTAWGYGFYRMNLLSPVDPGSWSRLLPDLRGGEGDGEGFGYLGAGMLLLLALAASGVVVRRVPFIGLAKRHKALIFALVLMTVYAWSDQIGLGTHSLSLGYAALLGGIKDTFRASGRFFWPAYYMLMLLAIAGTVSAYGIRRARWILAVALVLQVYDTSSGWAFAQRHRAEGQGWSDRLASPYWQAMGEHYATLRHVPPSNRPEGWADLAAFAARHGMRTDAVYLARVNEHGLAERADEARGMIASGRYDPDALYVLDDATATTVRQTLGGGDLLVKTDGFFVLAPGGRSCAACVAALDDTVEVLGPPRQGEVTFGNGANHDRLRSGWSSPEPWGVWTDGARATIAFPAPLPRRFRMYITGYAFGPNAGQDVGVLLDGSTQSLRLPAQLGEAVVEIDNPHGSASVDLLIPAPTSPVELGLGDDRRKLGVALTSLRIEEIHQ